MEYDHQKEELITQKMNPLQTCLLFSPSITQSALRGTRQK
jgi:hypothetical protein